MKENIPFTMRYEKRACACDVLNGHSALPHQQQSNTLNAVASADFYGGFGKTKHAQTRSVSFLHEEYGTSR